MPARVPPSQQFSPSTAPRRSELAHEAQLSGPIHQKARAGVARKEEPVEVRALVLPPREPGPGPEPQPTAHRNPVFRPAPHRDPDPRLGQLPRIALKRKVEDLDGALVRRAPDVAVRRERRTQPEAPPPPAPDLLQEALHVGRGRRAAPERHDGIRKPCIPVLSLRALPTGQPVQVLQCRRHRRPASAGSPAICMNMATSMILSQVWLAPVIASPR